MNDDDIWVPQKLIPWLYKQAHRKRDSRPEFNLGEDALDDMVASALVGYCDGWRRWRPGERNRWRWAWAKAQWALQEAFESIISHGMRRADPEAAASQPHYRIEHVLEAREKIRQAEAQLGDERLRPLFAGKRAVDIARDYDVTEGCVSQWLHAERRRMKALWEKEGKPDGRRRAHRGSAPH